MRAKNRINRNYETNTGQAITAKKKPDFYDRLPPGIDVLLAFALGAAILAFWYLVEFKLGIFSIIFGLIGFIGSIAGILIRLKDKINERQ